MRRPVTSAVCVVLCVLVALFSIFWVAPRMSSPETHQETIQYLEDRRTVVLELTGASTAASVAITLIPGDAGTPIAEKLADLSSAFLVIMTALVLEKYLVTLTCYVVFRFLIPVVCLLFLLFFLVYHETFWHAALRLLAFSLVLCLLVPLSVRLSMFIENTYQDLQVAVNSTLDQEDFLAEGSAEAESSAVAETAALADDISEAGEQAAESIEASRPWWQRALDQLTGRTSEAGAAVQEQIDRIKSDLEGIAHQVTVAPEKLSRLLNHYIEVVSVLIVTSCVIPVLVFFVFYWLVKLLFSLDGPPLSRLMGTFLKRT